MLDLEALARQVIREFGGDVRGDGPGRQEMSRRFRDLVTADRHAEADLMLDIAFLLRVRDKDRMASRPTTAERAASMRAAAQSRPPAVPVARSETPGPAPLPNVAQAMLAAQESTAPASHAAPVGQPRPAPSPPQPTKPLHRPEPGHAADPVRTSKPRPAAAPVPSKLQGIKELRLRWPGLASTVMTASGRKTRAERTPADVEFYANLLDDQSAEYAGMASRTLREAGERAAGQVEKSARFAETAKRERALLADMREAGAATEADLPPEVLDRHYARSVAA